MIERLEAERIASAVNHLRPEWPVNSLMTLLGRQEIRWRAHRDIVVAICWIAADPNTRTPGRLLEQGPWWEATATNMGKPVYAGTPRDHETCAVDGHSGWSGNCPQCRADKLAKEPA